MQNSLSYKRKDGKIVQAFKNQYTIRIFKDEDSMKNFMNETNNAEIPNAGAFYKYMETLINQCKPIISLSHLRSLNK